MRLLRRDGRLRPRTLWRLLVLALLLGAALGWGWRWFSQRTEQDRAGDTRKRIQHSLDQVTK